MKPTSSSSTKVLRITSISHVNISQAMKGNLENKSNLSETRNRSSHKKHLSTSKHFSLVRVTYLKVRLLSASSEGSSIMYLSNCSTWALSRRLHTINYGEHLPGSTLCYVPKQFKDRKPCIIENGLVQKSEHISMDCKNREKITN